MDPMNTASMIARLQSSGIRLNDPRAGAASRRGGAGPSDHKAVTIDGVTVMVPVHTAGAFDSPFEAGVPDADGQATLSCDGKALGVIRFPSQPRFYGLKTAEGVPYSQIATLHGRDVLATTVLQTCIRYQSRTRTCQFCAIGQSLAAGRTIARKTPAQLAEVAKAAVALDGVKHMVMTTGTPATPDRGASVLVESARAIRAAVNLPLQAQCEPPDHDGWFATMREAGIDTLGMHLEAVTPEVRARIMPGKASVPLSRYMESFRAAVPVFGRGQVSTYILAGLGDSREALLAMAQDLIAIGVYPFIVPFVPITGTPLESHPAPSPEFMASVLGPLADMLAAGGLAAEKVKAGCARCGACSALSTFEKLRQSSGQVASGQMAAGQVA
ncbi:MSMEG_0568 family radical SAM protein [Novosphingobium pituita]|uniref:MSMEG_0568 family radical SAM protein n=1 Tax=Novosphingobium pituita TaxID=3056842 RepID=A0ABQ6P6K7_9SPHN|nr:MSMEG_0568 family radical SAM protein [Novosphingobium sp. IK01]GMM60883.1 MSMEG_0568 family radical SAM protein [Novosphingobium sp. IK01]